VSDYDQDSLGRFGLGLKTASISQCRQLTVATRSSKRAKKIHVLRWDLDHIEERDEWEALAIPPSERPDHLVEPLMHQTGTVVLWSDLDRILEYKNPWGKTAKRGLLNMADRLEEHLSMVFHRFLEGRAGRRRKRRLKITINGTSVESWDPFARDEKKTIPFASEQFPISGDAGRGLVGYHAYILPTKSGFSSDRAHERAGRRQWNRRQGFYVYRSDRLIQFGGWSKLRNRDEHTKYARVALEFWPDLDSEFRLSVSKTFVVLPEELREELKPRVESLIKSARKSYDKSGGSVSRSARGSDGGSKTGRGTARGKGSMTPKKIARALDSAAKAAQATSALKRVKKVLRAGNPEVADELGW